MQSTGTMMRQGMPSYDARRYLGRGKAEFVYPDLGTESREGLMRLWLCGFIPHPEARDEPKGPKVYDFLFAKRLLGQCLSLCDLAYFVEYPDRLTPDMCGRIIPAWASVVRVPRGTLCVYLVPVLDCRTSADFKDPMITWIELGQLPSDIVVCMVKTEV